MRDGSFVMAITGEPLLCGLVEQGIGADFPQRFKVLDMSPCRIAIRLNPFGCWRGGGTGRHPAAKLVCNQSLSDGRIGASNRAYAGEMDGGNIGPKKDVEARGQR